MWRLRKWLEGGGVVALSGDLVPVVSPLAVVAPQEETRGIYLGVDDRGRDVYLNPERLPNMHGLILGTTGSGKSTLARHVVLEARRLGARVWVLDPHGEEAYKRMFETRVELGRDGINFLDAPGWDTGEYASELGRYVELIYGLRGSRNVFREIFSRCLKKGGLGPFEVAAEGEPDLKRVYDDLSRLYGAGLSIDWLAERDVYFTTPQMASREFVALGFQLLLLLLHGYMRSLGARHKWEMSVVLEEAHVVSQYLLSLYKEVRKWGYGVVAVTQLPREFDVRIYQLAGFVIVLSGSESYARDIASLFSLTSDEMDHILYSSRGAALFFRQGDPRPRKVFLKVRREALA